MRDIDFIVSPIRVDGPLLFIYREGALYSEMFKAVKSTLSAHEFLSGPDALNGGLFDGHAIPFLIWDNRGRGTTDRIDQSVALMPAKRMILFVHADWPALKGIRGNAVRRFCTIVEETRVIPATIPAIINYLDHHSPLGTKGQLVAQDDFRRYLTDSIDPTTISLQTFIYDFNESVLLHVDRRSKKFVPPRAMLSEFRSRNETSRHIKGLIEHPDKAPIAQIVANFSRRHQSADRGDRILRDLADHTVATLTRLHSLGRLEDHAHIRAAFAFLAILIAWSTPHRDRLIIRHQFLYQPDLAISHLFQLLTDAKRRLSDKPLTDPLSGLWLSLDHALQDKRSTRLLHDAITHARDFLLNFDTQGHRWLAALGRRFSNAISDSSQGALTPVTESWAWPKRLCGVEIFRQFIENRKASGRNAVPLILVGRQGFGKRTLARYFAASMTCEQQSNAPCCTCNCCAGILNNSSFGLSQHDASICKGKTGMAEFALQLEKSRNGIRATWLTIQIDNADDAAEVTSIFLKILEATHLQETFVFCVADLHNVNPALLSRSDVWHVRTLAPDDAISLIQDDAPLLPRDLAEIIARMAKGVPQQLKAYTQDVTASRALTVQEARLVLRLAWGQPLLAFCLSLVDTLRAAPQRLDILTMILSHQRLLTVLAELRLVMMGGSVTEPAFMHLDTPSIFDIAGCLQELAAKSSTTCDFLWSQLATAWIIHDPVDVNELAALVQRSHALVCHYEQSRGF
jgi:DNA polymerase III delta prime subunit